jgi:hypothetical protein
MRKTRIPIGLLIALTAGMTYGQDGQSATTPVITSAQANFAVTPATLTINGQNFGAVQPTVTLAGTPLTVQTFTQFFRGRGSAGRNEPGLLSARAGEKSERAPS